MQTLNRVVLLIIGILISQSAATAQTGNTQALDNYPDCGFSQQLNDIQVGAVVVNLDTGTGCVENLDERFHVASVPKIFVAGAYYDMLGRGEVSASTRLPFTERYFMGGRNACLTFADIGESFSNTDLVQRMINCSDNASTWLLMDSLGRYRIQSYVDNLGIEGLGEILPYSEVDRLKLSYIDPRWLDVPAGLAARFYRRGWTDGLDRYFSDVPSRPPRSQLIEANRQYFANHSSNTATPRAIADYLLMMRESLLTPDDNTLAASFLFETMLYTQRQYSMQYLPGTIHVASKNGFDRGLLAEVNVIFHQLEPRVPGSLAIVFLEHDDLTDSNGDLPGPFGGDLNDTMRTLSPQIRDWLYPGYQEPPVGLNVNLRAVTFQSQQTLQSCWTPYFRSRFSEDEVPSLENCFKSLLPRESFAVDENLAMGLTLRGLRGYDTRLTYIFTAPDGRLFSYQDDRRLQNDSAVYWYHPLDMPGEWQVDIYLNLQHVYSGSITAR